MRSPKSTAAQVQTKTIPVLRPRLPPAERLLPYLGRIDATRVYSNHGPLVSDLERRLADHPERDRIGLVVPVAPFGRPVPQHPWQTFRQQSGIPVVIDGAASFEA